MDKAVQNLGSQRPYIKFAARYAELGWIPLPLPPEKKSSPPLHTTGRHPDPTPEMVAGWIANPPDGDRSNIGLRMPDGVLGIDIDGYDDKVGWASLKELEAIAGPLPDTWTSSSRSDGRSGIRFYRVPKGLHWSGGPRPGIDIIQSHHRYAVAHPSAHPNGGTYQWYAPGSEINGQPGLTAGQEIPAIADLAELPELWVDILTGGRTTWETPVADDLASRADVTAWLKARPKRKVKSSPYMCLEMTKAVRKTVADIGSRGDAHYPLNDGMWNVVRLSMEGHNGVLTGAKTITEAFRTEVVDKRRADREAGKPSGSIRDPREAAGECGRSRDGAVRRAMGEAAQGVDEGYNLLNDKCWCFDDNLNAEDDESTDDDGGTPADPAVTDDTKDPSDYDKNDHGNAEHMLALYGKDMRWVAGLKTWMCWDAKAGRWLTDEDGAAQRLYIRMINRLKRASFQLYAVAEVQEGDEQKLTLKRAGELRKWAEVSGNQAKVRAALEAAAAFEGQSLAAETFDSNPRLLNFPNGVLELRQGELSVFRKARRDDYCSKVTGAPYVAEAWPVPGTPKVGATTALAGSEADKAGSAADYAEGIASLNAYLDRFIPDLELRRYVQKVLGYCLLGANPERKFIFLYGGTSTGKSTILNAVLSALGGYGGTVNLSLFREKADSGANTELINALPRRLVVTTETSHSQNLHVDVFKKACGNDRMTGRLNYSNTVVDRIPSFTPVVATNSVPTIEGADAATGRRVIAIPFDQIVREQDVDGSASDNLGRLAGASVLAWLVEGWDMYAMSKSGLGHMAGRGDSSSEDEILYNEDGEVIGYGELGTSAVSAGGVPVPGVPSGTEFAAAGSDDAVPASVRERTQEFLGEVSPFNAFLQEMVVYRTGARVLAADLIASYQDWGLAHNLDMIREVGSDVRIGKKVTEAGIDKQRQRPGGGGNAALYYLGIDLRGKGRVPDTQPSALAKAAVNEGPVDGEGDLTTDESRMFDVLRRQLGLD